MSNKISGFTVVFEDSVSEDYMDMVKNAIILYKGVASVKVIIEDSGVFIGAMQERIRINNVILDLVKSDFGRKVVNT